MIAVGDRIPDVELWLAPEQRVRLRELVRERPCLLFFYVLDWTHA